MPVISSLDLLNVYQGGQIATLMTGMTRLVTIVVFGLGCFTVAPRMYFSPDHSMWWVPGVIVGSAIPLAAFAMLSAPYVSTIRVLLPSAAKKNQEALMRFAEKTPPETKIMIQSMRWLPWPTHKEMFFGDLRRLPGVNLSANLEHVPLGREKQVAQAPTYLGGRLALRMYGKYWVNMTARNKSFAPGVWEKMWEQIPIKGQEPVKAASTAAKPVVMANRPAPVTAGAAGAKGQRPPPPPKAKGMKARR